MEALVADRPESLVEDEAQKRGAEALAGAGDGRRGSRVGADRQRPRTMANASIRPDSPDADPVSVRGEATSRDAPPPPNGRNVNS